MLVETHYINGGQPLPYREGVKRMERKQIARLLFCFAVVLWMMAYLAPTAR